MKVLHVEDDARDAESLLRGVLDTVSAQIAILDAHGTVIAVNEAWRQFARDNGGGAQAEQPVGVDYLAACGAAGADAREGIRAVLDGALPRFMLEYPCDSPDRQRWFLMSVRPLPGDRAGAIVAHENITGRKLAEEGLRQSERRYRELVSALPGAVYAFRIDAQGRRSFPFMSEGIGDLAGLSAGEIMADAQAAFGRVPAEAMPALELSIGASMQALSLWIHEFPIRAASGEERWLRGQSLPRREADGATVWHGVFIDITARKRAEEALLDSEVQIRLIADNLPVMIAYFDRDRRVRYANRNYTEFYCGPGADLRGRHLREVLGESSLTSIEGHVVRVIAGESVDYERETLRIDGERRSIAVHLVPHRAPGGQVLGAYTLVTDVTERKRAQAELRSSSANLHAIAENATVGITIFQDGRRVFANRRAAEMLGYTVEQFLPLPVAAVIHPESLALVLDRHRRRAAGEDVPARYEFTALAKDGRAVPLEGSYAVTEWNGRPAILVFATDIAERRIAQNSLRQSEANLRALTDNAAFGVVVLQDERRVFSNRRAAELVGYTTEEFTRLSINDHIHPDDRDALLERRRRRLAGESVPAKVEFTVRAKDGRAIPLEAQFATTTWNGQPARILFTTDITERKVAEDNLRRFRAAIDVSADLVLLIDPATMRYVDANEMACRVLSYSREELLAMGPQDVFSATREELAKVYSRLIAGDLRETAAEGWYRRKDGSRLWVESFRRAVPLAKGHAIVAVARDITERKATEKTLQLLSTGMAHLSGEAFFNEVAGRVAEYLEVEIGFVSRLQAPAESRIRTLGLSIDGQVMPPLEFDLAGTPCETVIGKQPTVLPEQVRQLYPAFRIAADLGVSGYAAVPLFDAHGKPIGAVGVMSRAPLRQNAERIEALLRLFAVRTAAEIERQGAEARFKDLFEFSADACLIVNQESSITAMNRGARALFGYSVEDLVGLPVETLLPEHARKGHASLRRDFFAAATSRPMGSGRSNLYASKKDGTTFPVDIDLHPLQTDDGVVVVATVRDLTAQRQDEERHAALESQLRHSQKMEAVGTLAGGIAHDFNNIIGAILGNAELAREDIGADHPAWTSITEIGKAGRRARDLVQQILAFSRKQGLSTNIIALEPVLEEAVKLLQATLPAGVQITSDSVTGLPNVSADPTQIHQVLVNLCTNAWHAMEGRPGRIDIHLEEVTVDAAFARSHAGLRPGRCVRLSVRDTGKGMDAAVLERIFEPFFTTKAIDEGTGLGLAVVHGIMQGHEGAVTVDSAPGKGTTFHLYFPAVDAPVVAQRAAAAVPALPHGRGQHVLYLDDDEALVSLVGRMLQRQGYRVSGYTLAQQALDAVRADPGGFDLVVTDYNMPGMSGLDVAREVSLIRPDLPVAVTSGYITDELREKAPQSGVRHLIYKPDTVDELCEVVRRLTSRTDLKNPRRA